MQNFNRDTVMADNKFAADRLVAVYDVFDVLSAPNPPLYIMPASQAYRTWQPTVPFPPFVAAHLSIGPPPPPVLHSQRSSRQVTNGYNKPKSVDQLIQTSNFQSGDPNDLGKLSHISSVDSSLSTVKSGYSGEHQGKTTIQFYNKKSQKKSSNYKDSVSLESSAPIAGKSASSTNENTKTDCNNALSKKTELENSGVFTLSKNRLSKSDSGPHVLIGRFPADPSGGGSVVITKTKSRVICRLEYAREFMLQCSLSPWTKLPPVQMHTIVHNFPELLPRGPQTFRPTEYRAQFNKLRSQSFSPIKQIAN